MFGIEDILEDINRVVQKYFNILEVGVVIAMNANSTVALPSCSKYPPVLRAQNLVHDRI